jgi:Ca2+-binding EF-hand superfamily protein
MFHKRYDFCNVAVLKKAFDAFDREKSGSISTNMVEEILRLMGQPFNRNTLEELIDEVDADSKYKRNSPLLGTAFKRMRMGSYGVCSG